MNEHGRGNSDENLFSCSSHDKIFYERLNMNEHDRGQSDENPFSCSSCDKIFYGHLNMNEHGRGHYVIYRHLKKLARITLGRDMDKMRSEIG